MKYGIELRSINYNKSLGFTDLYVGHPCSCWNTTMSVIHRFYIQCILYFLYYIEKDKFSEQKNRERRYCSRWLSLKQERFKKRSFQKELHLRLTFKTFIYDKVMISVRQMTNQLPGLFVTEYHSRLFGNNGIMLLLFLFSSDKLLSTSQDWKTIKNLI